MQMVRKILLAGLVFLGAMGVFDPDRITALSPATAGESEPVQVLWKHLSYRGSHFLGDAATEVSLTDVPAAEVRKQLIAAPEGRPLEAAACTVMVIDVQSTVDPLLGATDLSGSRAWLMSDNAAALQRIRSRHGDDIWQNTYRFTESGVYRIRKKPARADEKQLAPQHWTRIKESFYPYPLQIPEAQAVTEPTGLLYLISALDLGPQAAARSLYIFDRKQLHEVKVQVNGSQRLKVSYVEKDSNREIKRQGMVDAIKIAFQPRALAPHGEQPETFSFMGLKGEFEIYVDAASRIPVQVSGQISKIGKIHIRLQSVEF
ncbi:MAG: hypothetical protein P8X85_24175 [Desulfobacterales bacterium]